MIDSRYVPKVLAIMMMAGFYNESGMWAFTAGLPAKTGVGGGIVAVVPGKMAIVGFSPRVNEAGNSVRVDEGHRVHQRPAGRERVRQRALKLNRSGGSGRAAVGATLRSAGAARIGDNTDMLDPNSTEFLAHIGKTMVSADQPDMALEQTLETIRQGLRAEAASIFLFNEGEEVLECKASLGPNPATGDDGAARDRHRRPGGGPVPRRAGRGCSPSSRLLRGIDQKTGFITRSVVGAPLMVGDKVLGTVMLLNKAGNQQFIGPMIRRCW